MKSRFQIAIATWLILTALPVLPVVAAEPTRPAAADSATIAEYLKTSKKERKQHREEAQKLLEEAAKEENGMRRLALLRDAAWTDPASPDGWLALSERAIAMGYEVEGEAALDAARATLRHLKGDERRAGIGAYSLAMSWWYYRLAEWRKGEDWGKHAIKADVGLDAQLVRWLNRTDVFRSRQQYIEEMSPFYPYMEDWLRQSYWNWIRTMYYYRNYEEYDGPWLADRLQETLLPHRYLQEPLRWSDHGMYCEAHEDEDLALRFYELALDGVKSREGGWLQRHSRTNPVLKTPMKPMPFWTNPDGGYVTGSRLAYLGWLRDEMLAATDPTRQDELAEMVLRYADRTATLYDRQPWPLLWRVEALVELDEFGEADSAMYTARDQFQHLGITDPQLDRVEGHILLVQKKMGRAVPLLRQAVKDFPKDAVCWSDLGIAEAVIGDPAHARADFDQALALDPELATAWYNRGLLSLKEGDLESAQSDLERAARLVPDNETFQQELAALVQKISAKRRGG